MKICKLRVLNEKTVEEEAENEQDVQGVSPKKLVRIETNYEPNPETSISLAVTSVRSPTIVTGRRHVNMETTMVESAFNSVFEVKKRFQLVLSFFPIYQKCI